ncbi:MAG: tetratricopeptide repeat protein [Promethearchaeota archaeon]|nr:MAG: tetratricopeptide repeat protein [Candidatus Lokiarchaeota archaeon]
MKISNESTDVIEKAKNLLNQEKFEECIEILENLHGEKPNSEEIKNLLIKALFNYGGYLNDYYTLEYEKAKQIFERITKLSPKNYRAFYNLGLAYFNLNKIKEARKSFEIALKIKPDYKYCLYNLGLIYENKEEYTEALKYYDHALEIDPNFTYAITARSHVRRKLDQLKRMKIK